MVQTLTRVLVHIVFSTKDRADLITPKMEPEVYRYIGGVCRGVNSPLLDAGALPSMRRDSASMQYRSSSISVTNS